MKSILPISNIFFQSIYCAHIIQHLIRNKNLIIGNKRKLELASVQEGGADEATIESCRDSGFVRPVVLILCPFKKDAYDIINRLRRIVHGDSKCNDLILSMDVLFRRKR